MTDTKIRRPRPFHVDKGEVLKIGNCACCGGRVQIKANVAGKAYYNCGNFDEQGRSCGFGVRWGAAKSEDIRREYHKRNGTAPAPMVAANDNRPPRIDTPVTTPEPANIDAAPATKRKQGGTLDEFGL